MNYIYKIQDYLRLNHPTLWNLKIVQALALALVGNIVVFGLGYLSTFISREIERYSGYYSFYSYSEDPEILYFLAFILSILFFIVWMVFYFRNNRIKRFYPITSRKLYIEWLLSFMIISGFCLFPVSVKLGSMAKKRSYMTEQEVRDGLKLLNKVTFLDPNNGVYLSDDFAQKLGIEKENYRYRSLINRSESNENNEDGYLEVKSMLMKEDSLGISKLMGEYVAFQRRHVPQSQLSVGEWMKVVYQPPHYIIDTQSSQCSNLQNVLNINSIRYMYRNIEDGYKYDDIPNMFLVAFFFGLTISMTVFSSRITSGKSWLIALVTHFVILLLTSLFQFIAIGELVGYLIMWILIYGLCALYVWIYTTNNKNKGKTPILINLIITYSSVLLLFIFGILYGIADEIRDCHYDSEAGLSYRTNDGLYNFLDEWRLVFFWATMLLTILLMLPISKWALKWKALPEE